MSTVKGGFKNMGLLRFIKDAISEEPEQNAPNLVQEYTSADSFRGFKKLHCATYGDDEAMKNSMMFLGDEDVFDSVGKTITLYQIVHDDGTGISVYVDGYPVGVVWSSNNDGPAYQAAFHGEIDGVFVRIQRRANDRSSVSLYVKLH